MASRSTRKTWETAFLLSASMSSSYQQTFDQAQAILKDLGMENVQLGDEAERAAQRQENAITMAAAAIAEAGLTELLGGIKNAYTEIIQTTSEFEYTMSAVEAISGAAANEVAELEEKARTLGETTVYTARESAQAMTYMAQAGWDTTEMLEGMDGVISLAAASGTDLAEASSIVADTLAGFGMQANETGRLADVLAQTASRTNTNVSMMGQAFSYSAAVAGALGFEIEDVAAMMGLMANAGIKGSKAGTALRNIMNGLAKDVSLTSKAFGEVNVSMFDENGDSKGLVEFVRELRGYFDQMAKNEKIANAQNIATKRGYNGLLAILNATDKQFEEIYEDIQNADGAAKKMAETRLDNFQGDVTLLKSAFESLKITIGEELTPAGRGLVEWLTGLVQTSNEFAESHPVLIKGITAVTGGIASATAAVVAFAAAIKAFQAIKIVASLMGGAPGIVAALAGIAGLIWTIKQFEEAAGEQTLGLNNDFLKTIEIWEEAKKQHESLLSGYAEQNESIDSMVGKLFDLVGAEEKTAEQKVEILSLVDALNKAMPDLALSYDEATESINLTADAIRNMAKAEAERRANEANYERLVELQSQMPELERAAEDATQNAKKARSEYNDRREGLKEWEQEGLIGFLGSHIYNLVYGNEQYEEYRQAQDDSLAAYKALSEAQSEMRALETSIANYSAEHQTAAKEAGEEAAGQEQINEALNASGGEYDGDLDLSGYDNGFSMSAEDTSAQYEGAVQTGGGNVNITTNITVEGNASEETAEEIGAVVEEKIAGILEKQERRRERMFYTGGE